MDSPVAPHHFATAAAFPELRPVRAPVAEPPARTDAGTRSGLRGRAQPARRARARAALAALAVCLLVPIWWGAHGNYPWDVDHIAPGSTLKALAAGFGPTWSSSYGPVPYMAVGAAYVPALAFMRLAGELGHPSAVYPWGFEHPGVSILILVLLARLVSVLLALGVAWLAVRDTRRPGLRGLPWIAPLLLLGSETFAYYGRSMNVDIHALFWTWLGFHLVETPHARTRRLAAAAAAAAFAVCCKEQVAPFAVVIVTVAMKRAWGGRDAAGAIGPAVRRLRASGAARAAAIGLAALAAYLIVWRLPWAWPGWLEHHRFIFTEARYPRAFPTTFAGYADLAGRCAALLPLVLGPVALVGLGAAAALRVPLRGLGPRALGCALYLVGFIGTIGYVYPRFLLPLLLLAVPLGARTALAAKRKLMLRPRTLRALAAGTLALVLAGGPALGLVMLQDPRLAAERWLRHVATLRPHEIELVEIAGNPHFQARVPRGIETLRVSPAALAAHPRPPRGDVVLFSSVDEYGFEREAPEIERWLAPLRAPGGGYERVVFDAPPLARLARGLPVAPAIEAYVRR